MNKVTTRILLFLLIMNLLSGCAQLPLTMQEPPEISSFLDSVQTDKEVSDRAREHKEQGEIAKALSLLRAGSGKFPGNEEIGRLISEYELVWQQQRLVLQNQLLVIEARWLIESLPLMEQLAQGDQNNQLIGAQLLRWQSYLNSMEPELVNCGIELEALNIWLAKRCLNMAYRIAQTPESKQRLAAITNKIEAVELAARVEQERQVERKRADRVAQLLTEAGQARQQGALINAKVKIDEALMQDPESPRVREELSDLQELLGREAEALLKLGDSLYRNQQTEAAIAIWETALKLDPNQQQVTERIVRARNILNKLESIRSNTQPSMP